MSMTQWIDASKKEINSIIEYVRSQNYGIYIRVSIVSYRDFGQPELYMILPFTEDPSAPKQFLEQLGVENGFDHPEDVAGGL